MRAQPVVFLAATSIANCAICWRDLVVLIADDLRSGIDFAISIQLRKDHFSASDGLADAEALVPSAWRPALPSGVSGPSRFLRHAHVFGKKISFELGVAGDCLSGFTSRRGFSYQPAARSCPCAWGRRIGSHEQLAEIRALGVGGPNLLAVDDELVAVEIGASESKRRSEPAPGSDIPSHQYFVGGEDRFQVSLLLRRRCPIASARGRS